VPDPRPGIAGPQPPPKRLTAIHAVKKAIPVLGAGTKAVVIGAGLAVGLLVGRALKSANGSSRAAYRGSGQWSGTTRYGATGSYAGGSYGDRSYGTSSSYEAAGGYGASEDYTGGAGASTSTTTPNEER